MSTEKAKLDADQTCRCRVALTRLAQALQFDCTDAACTEPIVTVAEFADSLRTVPQVLDDVAEVPR
jgi:hypothetical protein